MHSTWQCIRPSSGTLRPPFPARAARPPQASGPLPQASVSLHVKAATGLAAVDRRLPGPCVPSSALHVEVPTSLPAVDRRLPGPVVPYIAGSFWYRFRVHNASPKTGHARTPGGVGWRQAIAERGLPLQTDVGFAPMASLSMTSWGPPCGIPGLPVTKHVDRTSPRWPVQ